MSADIESFLTPDQVRELKEMGMRGNKWNELLREMGGNENLAGLVVDLRGVEELGGIPDNEKPRLCGPSPRVAAQKHAAKRPY